MNKKQPDRLDIFLKLNAPVAPAAPDGEAERIFSKIELGPNVVSRSKNSGIVAALSLAAVLALGVFVSLTADTVRDDSITAPEVLVAAVLDLQEEEETDDLYGDWIMLVSAVSEQ